MASHATTILDKLDQRVLRERLRQLDEERSALIALIRAVRARERVRGSQQAEGEATHAPR